MKSATFWPANELPKFEFQEPAMLVEPIVPWAGMILMHGPRTAGKTQLALSLAAATSIGGRWLGKYVCARARTAYIQVDMSPRLLQSRVRQAKGELVEVTFFTADSFDIAVMTPSASKAFGALLAYDPQFIIVDSLRKTHRMDENDSNSPSRVYQRWRDLFPGSAFCFLHHDRKVPIGPDAGDVDEAFRGSSAWLDDVDTGLHLQRDKKAKRHSATLTFSKVRTAEAQAPIPIVLDTETMLAAPGEATARTALMGWLAGHPGGKASEATKWLTENGFCSRSFAYTLVKELDLP